MGWIDRPTPIGASRERVRISESLAWYADAVRQHADEIDTDPGAAKRYLRDLAGALGTEAHIVRLGIVDKDRVPNDDRL